jgi:hypothetical protein
MSAVKRYDILDTPPDGAFDRLTAIAARRFHVPISIISIVDHDRIWFKSHAHFNSCFARRLTRTAPNINEQAERVATEKATRVGIGKLVLL